jgi:hypothetical protein
MREGSRDLRLGMGMPSSAKTSCSAARVLNTHRGRGH